jgi:hypothetical protein
MSQRSKELVKTRQGLGVVIYDELVFHAGDDRLASTAALFGAENGDRLAAGEGGKKRA